MKRRKKLSAFTLVEAIMSVAILSMVLAMVYGVFYSMLRSTEAGAETALQVQRNRVALKTLEDAFSGLVYYQPKDNSDRSDYAFIVDTLDFDYPSVSFVSRVPPDFLGSKEFGSQTLRRITFQVEDDEDFGRSLVMYQSATLQLEDEFTGEEPSRWVLGQDLDQFLMLFYSTSVDEWINEWAETNSVPSRIKFELAYARPDGGAAQIEDMHKREFSLFSRNITKEMRLQKLKPAPKKTSTRGRPNSPPKSSPSRGKPTAEQIAAWRKRREEEARKRQRDNDGKRKLPEGSRRVSDYGRLQNTAKRYDANGDGILDSGERAKWRADYAASRNSQSSGGAKGTGTGTGGDTGGGDTGGGDTGGGDTGGGDTGGGDTGGGGGPRGGGGVSVLPGALTLNDELARFNAGTLEELVDMEVYPSMEDLQSTAPDGAVWVIDPDTGLVVPDYQSGR